MLPGSPPGRKNSARLAALLPSGKWNFDPAKSTIKTLIQYDIDLPWGNFGSSCVKMLVAEAILELFEHIPGGRQAALWKSWSNSHSEREATTTEQHRMGKRKLITQSTNQNSKMLFFLFHFPFFLMYNGFFFLLFFWRTGFTHFIWNSLSAQLCNGNEKKRYLVLTICYKIHGERFFICM